MNSISSHSKTKFNYMVVLLPSTYAMLRSVDREKLNMNERMLSEPDINVNHEKMCVRDK